MPPRETTAAQPLVLLDYAATGTELCARQRQLAAQLAPVLERLMQSCTEYAIGVGEFDLVGRMQRSADTTEHTHDQWLRSVAEAFLDADTGVVTTTAQEMIAALAASPATRKAHLSAELAKLETVADRFAYVQTHYPELIRNQQYPTSEKGNNAHIMTDLPTSELMLGTRVDYGMNIGDSIHSGDLRIRSFVINDPSLRAAGEAPSIYEGPSRWNWHNAEWTVPGTHLLVYEVTFGDEPPQYYTMEQTIVEPEPFAAQQLALQNPPLNMEMYLLSLTMMLEQAEQSEAVDPEQIEQLAAALANAEALLAEGGTPLPAVLVTEETSQTLPLNLFVQETAEGFAIIDLTNPDPKAARTYRGDTLEAAWADFVENNTLPAGQLAATPPTERESSPDLWNVHSNGRSTLEEWSNGLGWLSTIAVTTGVVLMFVPGTQIPGAAVLGTIGFGAGTGVVASGLSIADRVQYGNFRWRSAETYLDAADLLSNLFVVTRMGTVGMKLSTRAIGSYGVALEVLETGTDAAGVFIISNEYYKQIEAINADPLLSDAVKQEQISEVIQQAFATGALLIAGSAFAATHSMRDNRAVARNDVSVGLRDALNGSPTLQQMLARHDYNPADMQGLWHQWKSAQGQVPYRRFEDWLLDIEQRGLSLSEVNAVFDDAKVRETMADKPAMRGKMIENMELFEVMQMSPIVQRSLLARPNTMNSLVEHPLSLDILQQELARVEREGVESIVQNGSKPPAATPLTAAQVELSRSIKGNDDLLLQPGFDPTQANNSRYVKRYLDDLYRQSAVATQELEEMADAIATATGGTPDLRPEPKNRQRAEDKVKGYGGMANELNDLTAGKIEYDTIHDLYDGLAMIKDNPEVSIVYIKDRLIKPQNSGYRDILMNVKMSNGHVAELRLHLKDLDVVAEYEHPLYEVRRDLEALAKEEKRDLTDDEKAIVLVLEAEAQRLYWEGLQRALMKYPE